MVDLGEQERIHRLNALGLLTKRDDAGSLLRDANNKPVLIGAVEARQLLGKCATIDGERDMFSLLVPVSALLQIGLAPVWENAPLPKKEQNGQSYYHVNDYMQSVAILDLLTVQAGCTLEEAQAFYARMRGEGSKER